MAGRLDSVDMAPIAWRWPQCGRAKGVEWVSTTSAPSSARAMHVQIAAGDRVEETRLFRHC